MFRLALVLPLVCFSIKVHFFYRTAHPNVAFHQNRLQKSQNDLDRQIKSLKLSASVKFSALHRSEEDYYSDFLVMNALDHVQSAVDADVDWIFFAEEHTFVELELLLEHLTDLNDNAKPKMVGRGLFDREAAIIHHFYGIRTKDGEKHYKDFPFPDFDAGFVINAKLLASLVEKLPKWRENPNFQIDPKHEFVIFMQKQLGLEMAVSKHFCGGNWHRTQKTCFTRAGKELPDCGLTENTKLFVAVKTTEKFHKDRLKVVAKTWGPKLDNIVYYSNVTDASIPTQVSGPNTERGHCQKLYHILDKFNEMKGFDWLYVADDDTIFSAYRLHRITACYDADEPVFIGERYGYGLNTGRGYPYITGGGGMLFSRAAVKAWKTGNCRCPTPDSPDDMMIGSCLSRHGKIVHLNNFHQARPDDYSEGYLDNNTPLSFHKHWNNDPLQVYANWFGRDDTEWWSTKAHDHPDNQKHQEL